MPAEPWYAGYFAPQWWEVAGHEYTAERTAAEVAYLAGVLKGAPGRRVVDLGCGLGRHAIGLAALGFDVVGLDASAWAIQTARGSATARDSATAPDEAAVGGSGRGRVRFERCDLLRTTQWPISPVDAAISVQSFGWGGDAQQERLLRTVRRHLVPGGLLILDHSSATAILRHHVPYAEFRADGLEADFHRAYQALTGRSAGRIAIRSAASGDAEVHDDIRLYQPPEIVAMVQRAGFTVERIDADFSEGADVAADSRYVQVIARAENLRPAVAGWSGPGPAAGELDLRWTPDEYDYVREAVEAALDTVDTDPRAYAVSDPFGGRQSADTIARHFSAAITPEMVTFGAGATGVLQALAMMALPGPLVYAHRGHPDAPAWMRRLGGDAIAADDVPAAIEQVQPSMVLVDRPTASGDLAGLADVADLAERAAAYGAVVAVDEAYATYAGAAASAVSLVPEHPNLVVVRSMSKGYCCGGLRAGFAVAGPALTKVLQEFAAPLAVSASSMAACLALLDAGDVFAALRHRISVVKPLVGLRLRAAGCAVREGSPILPWVGVRADDGIAEHLRAKGLLLKEPVDGWLKVALPLSPRRLAQFEAAVSAAGAGTP